MMLILGSGRVLLERRAPSGIWGGLWSLPEIPYGADGTPDPAAEPGSEPGSEPGARLERLAAAAAQERYGLRARKAVRHARLSHGFTHFKLEITVVRVSVAPLRTGPQAAWAWFDLASAPAAGVPAPVRRILQGIDPTQAAGLIGG
jgi:A/G-specific adenine glycosylase